MSRINKWSSILLLIFVNLSVFGQIESFPCKCCNSNLRVLFKGKVLNNLYVHDCKGAGLHELSSSFLIPNGTPPKIVEDPEGGPPDDAAYVKWTCMYSIGNISDGDPKTAWVEGVEGSGVGEVFIVPCLDLKQSVRIWAGYGKSDAIFMANNRPRKIRLVIVKSELIGASQYGNSYENLSVIAETEVKLEDKNGYQKLQMPKYKVESYFSTQLNEKSEYKYFLGIEILDVYKGTKYDDTCISEISNE